MYYSENNYLCHHGVKGQKWGFMRYQNADGSLTAAGRKRHNREIGEAYLSYNKSLNKYNKYKSKLSTASGKKAVRLNEKIKKADNDRKTRAYELIKKSNDGTVTTNDIVEGLSMAGKSRELKNTALSSITGGSVAAGLTVLKTTGVLLIPASLISSASIGTSLAVKNKLNKSTGVDDAYNEASRIKRDAINIL